MIHLKRFNWSISLCRQIKSNDDNMKFTEAAAVHSFRYSECTRYKVVRSFSSVCLLTPYLSVAAATWLEHPKCTLNDRFVTLNLNQQPTNTHFQAHATHTHTHLHAFFNNNKSRNLISFYLNGKNNAQFWHFYFDGSQTSWWFISKISPQKFHTRRHKIHGIVKSKTLTELERK